MSDTLLYLGNHIIKSSALLTIVIDDNTVLVKATVPLLRKDGEIYLDGSLSIKEYKYVLTRSLEEEVKNIANQISRSSESFIMFGSEISKRVVFDRMEHFQDAIMHGDIKTLIVKTDNFTEILEYKYTHWLDKDYTDNSQLTQLNCLDIAAWEMDVSLHQLSNLGLPR